MHPFIITRNFPPLQEGIERPIKSSRLLEPGNYVGMAAAIFEILNHEADCPRSREFAARFASPELSKELRPLVFEAMSSSK